ncbi:MAG TPA: monovalent cation/H+ antiporter complex subunit F [Corynebacterium sp.]|nr:monovalent cation/H+ antiporter complex subunit F [Corynebacterium sp.]
MTVISIAIVIVGLSTLPAAYRMLMGPTPADRVSAADLLLFILVALLALVGVGKASGFTFDLVFVAALVGFLSAVSLARALMRGER